MNYAWTLFQARFIWRCLYVPKVPDSVKNLTDDDDDVTVTYVYECHMSNLTRVQTIRNHHSL